jgi:glycosyltransferase 2 family protein
MSMLPAAAPMPAAARSESLRDRFLDPRTLISFVVLALVLWAVLTHVRLDYRQSLTAIGQTNLLLYAAAFIAFYLSLGVRALRWQLLLRNTGEDSPVPGLFHIIILAFFANCLLPAKMGDFYRAYLARQRTPISGTKALGTIVSERVIDFLVLMSLLIISGLISFHAVIPSRFVPAVVAGVAMAAALVVGLVGLRFSRGWFSRYLPHRYRDRVRSFKAGLLDAFGGRPLELLGLSVLVWALESSRLYLVVQALPLHLSLNPAQVVFIALVASLLTTIPALPGGLVLVEGGIVAVFLFFGFTASQGFTVAILDRVISYWSLVAIGLVTFLLTRHR